MKTFLFEMMVPTVCVINTWLWGSIIIAMCFGSLVVADCIFLRVYTLVLSLALTYIMYIMALSFTEDLKKEWRKF